MIILYSILVIAGLWTIFRLVTIELDNFQNVIYKLALNIISIWLAWQNAQLEVRQKSYMIEDTEWREVGRQMIKLNRG